MEGFWAGLRCSSRRSSGRTWHERPRPPRGRLRRHRVQRIRQPALSERVPGRAARGHDPARLRLRRGCGGGGFRSLRTGRVLRGVGVVPAERNDPSRRRPAQRVLSHAGVSRVRARLDLWRRLLVGRRARGQRAKAPLLLRHRHRRSAPRDGRRRRLDLSRRMGGRRPRGLLSRHDRAGRCRGAARGLDLPHRHAHRRARAVCDVRAPPRGHGNVASRAFGRPRWVGTAGARSAARASRIRHQGRSHAVPRLASRRPATSRLFCRGWS
jgi:hypothetical protein